MWLSPMINSVVDNKFNGNLFIFSCMCNRRFITSFFSKQYNIFIIYFCFSGDPVSTKFVISTIVFFSTENAFSILSILPLVCTLRDKCRDKCLSRRVPKVPNRDKCCPESPKSGQMFVPKVPNRDKFCPDLRFVPSQTIVLLWYLDSIQK